MTALVAHNLPMVSEDFDILFFVAIDLEVSVLSGKVELSTVALLF